MVAGSAELLTSDHMVGGLDQELRERSAQLEAQFEHRPTLQIITDNFNHHKPTQKYVEGKCRLAAQVGISAAMSIPTSFEELAGMVDHYSQHDNTDAIITQLPPRRPEGVGDKEFEGMVRSLLNNINPEKDVDGLGENAMWGSATAHAVRGIMRGNGIDYANMRVAARGMGALVNAPLVQMLREEVPDIQLRTLDEHSSDEEAREVLNEADIIITATGKPGLLTPEWFDSSEPKVIIDAGTATQEGVVRGDMSPEMRTFAMEHGWAITPTKGGVGPLTMRMLLRNVMGAAEKRALRADFTPTPLREGRDARFNYWTPARA